MSALGRRRKREQIPWSRGDLVMTIPGLVGVLRLVAALLAQDDNFRAKSDQPKAKSRVSTTRSTLATESMLLARAADAPQDGAGGSDPGRALPTREQNNNSGLRRSLRSDNRHQPSCPLFRDFGTGPSRNTLD